MLHGSSGPGIAGSELTRLLARWAPAPQPPLAPTPPAAFAERLGQWLGWTDAIALAAVLGEQPASQGAAPAASGAAAAAADVRRVQAALAASMAPGLPEPGESPTDFAPYRRHCQERQQAMHDAIGPLRHRVRAVLARQSPGLAQLAAIDAVLDDTLAARQRGLLALLTQRLHAHFDALQARAAPGDTTWTATFRNDLHQLLLAELEHRLLPTRGLLAALQHGGPAPTALAPGLLAAPKTTTSA